MILKGRARERACVFSELSAWNIWNDLKLKHSISLNTFKSKIKEVEATVLRMPKFHIYLVKQLTVLAKSCLERVILTLTGLSWLNEAFPGEVQMTFS